MSTSVAQLEAEALNLPAAQRARLVEKLIASLDTEPDIENAWAAEVEKRHAEIESGTASLLPGAKVCVTTAIYINAPCTDTAAQPNRS